MIKALPPFVIFAVATETLSMPDPRGYQGIGWFIVVAAVTLGAVLMGAYYAVGTAERWRNLRRGDAPQQRNVNINEALRTVPDCEKIHGDLDINRRDFRLEHKEQHSALNESDKAQWKKINSHDDAIKDLPQQIVTLLRNTGAIK